MRTDSVRTRDMRAVQLKIPIILLLVAAVFLLGGCGLFKDRSVSELTITDAAEIDIDDLLKYDNLMLLDIRGAQIEPEVYDSLQSALPNCRILWSVPIAGMRFDSQVTQITLPADTTGEELALLDYLPNLVTVDATACSCYDALVSKSIERGDISFVWSVKIAGVTALNTDRSLDLSGRTLGGADALLTSLNRLPGLTALNITNTDITEDEGEALAARFPNIAILRTLDLFGVLVPTDTTALNLTGADVINESQLIEKLAQFPNLESVDCTGITLSFDAMDQLEGRFPLVSFSFSFMLFDQLLTPETTVLDLTGYQFAGLDEAVEGLRHLPALTSLTLSGSTLTSEEIETLMDEYPQVKCVWLVQIGAWQVRTDITAFSTSNRESFPDGAGMYTGEGDTALTDEDAINLRYLTDLVYLDVTGSKLTDLSFVQYMPNLRMLNIGGNRVESLAPLTALTALECLEAYGNPVIDASPLSGLSQLLYLNIGRSSISDATPLAEMKQLRMLWIMGTKLDRAALETLAASLADTTIYSSGSNPLANNWRENPVYLEFLPLAGLES